MNMNRLNVFRRLDELETANLHLQVMLKSTRLELTALKSGVTILHNAVRLKPKPAPRPEAEPKTKKLTKVQAEAVRAVKAAYARKYYAKKRAAREEAEKLAVMP